MPRTWTHLLFEAAGRPLDPASATPRSWREYVSQATSQSAPETMTEGGQGHFDPLTAFETGYHPAAMNLPSGPSGPLARDFGPYSRADELSRVDVSHRPVRGGARERQEQNGD